MLNLCATTDKFQVVTSTAAVVDVHVSGVEVVTAGATTPTPFKQNTNFASATTKDVCDPPGASNTRTAKEFNIRNRDAALSVQVTVNFNQNATLFEIHSVLLRPGETLSHTEQLGWFVSGPPSAPNMNYSSTDQAIGASTTAYLAGSAIAIPSTRPIQIGTLFRWRVALSKTGAGTAACTWNIVTGTAGTTADTPRCAFVGTVQTAVIDAGYVDVGAIIRGPIGASCILSAHYVMGHNLSVTGLISNKQNDVILTDSAGFDCTTAGLIVGLTLITGASYAYTIKQVLAENRNL